VHRELVPLKIAEPPATTTPTADIPRNNQLRTTPTTPTGPHAISATAENLLHNTQPARATQHQ